MFLSTLNSITSMFLIKESGSNDFPYWLVIVGAIVLYFVVKDKEQRKENEKKKTRYKEDSSYREKTANKKSDYWNNVLTDSGVSNDYSSIFSYQRPDVWKRLDNAYLENIPLKDDYKFLIQLIKEKRITCLYHFTDEINIRSIQRNGGLYSWKSCERRGIYIPRPGSDHLSKSLDDRKNLGDYVRLSFNPKQPMLYVAQREGRINKPVILKIDPVVMLWKTTLFSNINAAANAAHIGPDSTDFMEVRTNFALSEDWTTEEEKRYFQAEVLVKSHIPLEYITFPSFRW